MKKNLPLLAGIAAIAFGIWYLLKNKTATTTKVGSTGTASAPATSFWDALLNRGSAIAGQGANRAVYGSSGGASNGADLTPIIKSGIGAISGLASKYFDKLFGSKPTTDTTTPGTSSGFGSETVTGTPYFSTWNDYRAAQDFQDYNDLFDSPGTTSTPLWDMQNDLPLDQSPNLDDYYDIVPTGSYDSFE